MKKLIKASMFAAAFLFVAGCATQHPPKPPCHSHHKHHHCIGKKCYDKLGAYAKHDKAK